MKKSILAAFALSLPAVTISTFAQSPGATADPAEVTTMEPVVVSAEVSPAQAGVKKDEAFQRINLSLGTSAYTLTDSQIRNIAQGENTSLNNILTRTPGVSADTYGAIHFRNEDPFYRIYINGVLLPKGTTGFAQTIDPRFIESMTTLVGAVPAYYPDGNFGVIDIKTKTGESVKGGELSFYGGSYNTYQPSISYGNTIGDVDFFFTASYLHDSLGLENPTASHFAMHDDTNQLNAFGIVTLHLQNDASISLMGSANYANFQIPNTPGQETEFVFEDPGEFYKNSTNLNSNQNEQSYFGILSYQQDIGDVSLQVSNTSRFSRVLFNPDIRGSLYYNAISTQVYQQVFTNDTAIDLVWQIGDSHTVRGGVLVEWGQVSEDDSIITFPVDGDDEGEGGDDDEESFVLDQPNAPYDTSQSKWAVSTAVYLQDEWKVTRQLTLNYGIRFEQVSAYVSEFQFSPRVNLVYQPVKQVAIHGGYARYFAPPPLQSVSPATINQFAGTTGEPDTFQNDPVKSERSDYFDVGVNYRPFDGLEIGVDAYYKIAKDQVDDGEFGEANIAQPYNYAWGDMYGVDISASYVKGPFSSFINFSFADGWATGITSSQFEFETEDLDYINGNYVRFDQVQLFIGSAGMAYTWNGLTLHTDMIYQDGIRTEPFNQGKLDPYFVWNVGAEYVIKHVGPGDVRLRFDILNLLDSSYVLNSGTGIGEGAVKYGNRIGFYGGISYEW